MFFISTLNNSINRLHQMRDRQNCSPVRPFQEEYYDYDNTLQYLLQSLIEEDQLIHSRLIGRLYWLRKEDENSAPPPTIAVDEREDRHYHEVKLRITECAYCAAQDTATEKLIDTQPQLNSRKEIRRGRTNEAAKIKCKSKSKSKARTKANPKHKTKVKPKFNFNCD